MRRIFLQAGLAAAAAMLVAGCATGVKHEQMASAIPSLKPGEGRIYFFRTNSMLGVIVQPEIRLDGTAVGRSQPGGFFYVDRPAGSYVVSATTEAEKTGEVILRSGETRYIRTSVAAGYLVGRLTFEQEVPDKARAEIASLSYTGR